jgi:hypothetical protein
MERERGEKAGRTQSRARRRPRARHRAGTTCARGERCRCERSRLSVLERRPSGGSCEERTMAGEQAAIYPGERSAAAIPLVLERRTSTVVDAAGTAPSFFAPRSTACEPVSKPALRDAEQTRSSSSALMMSCYWPCSWDNDASCTRHSEASGTQRLKA